MPVEGVGSARLARAQRLSVPRLLLRQPTAAGRRAVRMQRGEPKHRPVRVAVAFRGAPRAHGGFLPLPWAFALFGRRSPPVQATPGGHWEISPRAVHTTSVTARVGQPPGRSEPTRPLLPPVPDPARDGAED